MQYKFCSFPNLELRSLTCLGESPIPSVQVYPHTGVKFRNEEKQCTVDEWLCSILFSEHFFLNEREGNMCLSVALVPAL